MAWIIIDMNSGIVVDSGGQPDDIKKKAAEREEHEMEVWRHRQPRLQIVEPSKPTDK